MCKIFVIGYLDTVYLLVFLCSTQLFFMGTAVGVNKLWLTLFSSLMIKTHRLSERGVEQSGDMGQKEVFFCSLSENFRLILLST